MLLPYSSCLNTETPLHGDCVLGNGSKGPSSQSCGFSSSHVWMWLLDHKESWTLKNWCFWTVVLEKTLESPLDCKEIQPVHPKGNQPWIFIERTDAEAEASLLWAPDVKSQFIIKDPDARKDWRQEEKGTTEGDMVGWYHWLHGYEFKQTQGDSKEQGSLVCCSPWGCRESDTIWWLNKQQLFRTIFWTAWDSAKHPVYCTLESAAPSQLHTTAFFCPLLFHHNESNGT